MTGNRPAIRTEGAQANLTRRETALLASADFLDGTFQANADFVTQLAVDIVSLAHPGEQADDTTIDDALARFAALVKGVAPQDEVEAMLATQMAAIHNATVEMASRLRTERHVNVAESYERSLNRLARTFTTQIEALKKYRSKGEQKVIVEHQHVHVYPGGQAVVGNVTQGGGTKTEGLPHERQLRLSERAAVLGTIEADQVPMPGAGDEGMERLSVPRSKGRAALRAVE